MEKPRRSVNYLMPFTRAGSRPEDSRLEHKSSAAFQDGAPFISVSTWTPEILLRHMCAASDFNGNKCGAILECGNQFS